MPRATGDQQVKEDIAREIAAVHLESYGQPVDNVVVELGESFVTVLMDVTLSPAERTLVEGGKGDAVRVTRERYQDVIESTFRAIVERAGGRRVESFASRTVVEDGAPSWSAEIFRLAPRGSTGDL